MKFYPFLLASCFTFLKKVETSFIDRDDQRRAFQVALIFALAEMINVHSFVPMHDPSLFFVPFSILGLINYLIFIPNRRYVKYVEAYRSNAHKNIYGALTILYFLATAIFYCYSPLA